MNDIVILITVPHSLIAMVFGQCVCDNISVLVIFHIV